ncbi:MAG: hypothetical protein A2033_16110 [Bacteroidetes bacterium GWA2_31_9]|nr:MAG: hypothetical protein A2033_16110 [Bacteroidetes bacterium GWA2_31_9]
MKTPLFAYLLTIILTFPFFSFGEILTGNQAEKIISGAMKINFDESHQKISYIEFNEKSKFIKSDFTVWLQILMKKNNVNIKFLNSITDKNNFTHDRYLLTYNNYALHDGMVIVHSKDNFIKSINGNIYKDFSVTNKEILSESSALQKALNYVNADLYKWEIKGEEELLKSETNNPNATYYPVAEKYLIKNDDANNSYYYTYRFNIYSQKPLKRAYIFVDCESGKIVKELNLLQEADVVGTAQTKYSGTQPITTDSYNGSFRLRETARGNGIETYNALMGTNYNSAVDFTDTDNNWNNINAQFDEVATDAHWSTEMTYDYYLNVHSRNSIDGNGFKLMSYVHFNLVDYGYNSNVNAFWDGQRMTYGDGEGSITPLTTVDICGHEVTHGLTSNTANLDYQDESGALNESFSDIFGTAIEFYAKPAQANWTVGEDIGIIIRSISNPNDYSKPDTYQGDFWISDGSDNGGVHTNSLVYSYWFYLTSLGGNGTNDIGNSYSVSGIGIDKAEAIAFRTLTVYLTNTSNYVDARFYTIQSAIDLYGGCSTEVETVTNAFYAVGVGGLYVPQTLSDFSSALTAFCKPPANVAFTNNSINGTTFLWNFGDGNTSSEMNPTHSYSAYGNFNVQLIADGGVCGIDTLIIPAFVSVDNSNQCVQFMTQSGSATDTSCSGKLFDSGGSANYQDNTDAVFVISPSGASAVVLDFISFDFEIGYDYLYIYDGTSTSSTLIGQFDGNNLPNGGQVVSSGSSITIQQTTDQGLTKAGFELDWHCLTPNDPPVAGFYTADTNNCSGIVNFIDLSFNNPTSWLWIFGDGNSSTLQNPTHIYLDNGNYTVRLITHSSGGSDTLTLNNYVNVSKPDSPIANDNERCGQGTIQLTATSSGSVNWYDTQTNGNLLFTGSTFTTPVISTNTQYFAETVIETQVQNTGMTDNSGGGGYFGSATNIHYLVFDSYTPFKLISVKVYADGAGQRSIALRQDDGTILQTLNVQVPNGESRVTLNFDVPADVNLQLVGLGVPNLYRNNAGVSYPYEISGVVSIFKSSAGTAPYDYYYYFYDWEIKEQECTSSRVPVNAIVHINNFAFPLDTIETNLPYIADAGTGFAIYSWSNGASSQTSTITNYGWVYTTVTDNYGCVEIDSVYITNLTSINLNQIEALNVEIFPNPASDLISIKFKNSITKDWNIKLLNSFGAEIENIEHNIISDKIDLNTSSLDSGIYWLVVKNSNSEIKKKIVIIR